MAARGLAITLAIACTFLLGEHAAAQDTMNGGTVSGRVIDPQGAVTPGASVSARQIETNVTTDAVTGADGRFRFPHLNVGHYEIVVRLQGFRDATRLVTVSVGSAFDFPITLSLSGVTTSVTVTAETAPLIETARTQIASTVTQGEIRDLPLNGRQFLDVALLAPGVAPANVGSTQLFAETSAVPGPGLSVSSQRNLSNSFIVDGLSANDDAAGLSLVPYGIDAIEQLQVVTSGGQAEFGRALGGYVNVVTRSGTNDVRGDAYGYVRDDQLNAANPLLGRTLPMRQNQYGASIGGPIRRDRAFYFANVEQRRLNQSGLTTIAAPAAALINARLAAVAYPGLPVATGVYPNPVDSTNVLAKIDDRFGGTQVGVRYSLYHVSASNARGAGGLSAPSASAALDNADHVIAAQALASLSSTTTNEARAQAVFSDLKAPPSDLLGPAVSISGVASFGTLSGSPTQRVNRMYEVADTLSHQAGAHALRVGADFLFNDDAITFPRAIRGAYTFASLENFLAGAYNTAGFTQTFGAAAVSQTNPNVGLYAQDEWKVAPEVTLHAGLRYDLQFLQTVHTDTNNLAPRIGLAWSPGDDGRTVVRASAGLFYDRVPLRAVANALLSASNTTDVGRLAQIAIALSPAQASAPAFPSILSAPVPSVTLPNLTTMDPDIQNASSRQASVEVERQIGERATIGVGYEYLRGSNLIAAINQNVATCAAAGTNNGCRPNPNYANNSQYSSAASSAYHGLHVSLVQRPARWGQYRVSYTLSKAMDDVGQFFFSAPLDPFDISRDWARSDDDQRHRLVVSGAVNTPSDPAASAWQRVTHGWQLSALVQAYSALPLNVTSGVTTIEVTPARPLASGPTSAPVDVRAAQFISRNAGIGPDFFNLSLRASRAFHVAGRLHVEGLIEVFNVTNRANAVTLNGNFGTGAYPANPLPNFGQVLAVGEPRSAQVAVRVRF